MSAHHNPKKYYDLANLRDLMNEDEVEVKKMLAIFCESTPETLTLIQQSYAEKNMDQVANYAHKLKSSIDILSIAILSEKIRLLEGECKKGQDSPEIRQLIDEVTQVMQDTLFLLKTNEI